MKFATDKVFKVLGKRRLLLRVFLLTLQKPLSEPIPGFSFHPVRTHARLKKKFRVNTTNSNHDGPIADRVFKSEEPLPDKPREVLAGDITYLRLGGSFLYLAVVMDIYNLNPEVLQKNPLKAPPSRHFRIFQVLKFISQATHT